MTPSRLPQILMTLLGLAAFGAVALFAGRPAMQQPSGSAAPSASPAPQAQQAATPPAAPVALPASPASPAAPETTPPSFDVVRVEPNGDYVIAGRAMPGARVELLRDGSVHARATADSAGQFVITEPALPAGPQELALRVDGAGAGMRSRQSVTVVVAQGGKEPPLVALAVPGQPTVTLSQPKPPAASPPAASVPAASVPAAPATAPATATAPAVAPAASPAAAPGGDVVVQPPTLPEAVANVGTGTPGVPATTRVGTVEADEGGRLMVSGTAAPGATVRLYLNDTYLAEAKADTNNRVAFVVEKGVTPGDYRVRLDTTDGAGNVTSRAEVPFNLPVPVAAAPAAGAIAPGAFPPPVQGPGRVPSPQAAPSPAPAAGAVPVSPPAIPVVVPEIRTATVVRGDSLWRISRRLYGQGVRYTVIYEANQQQIRNPDLIYPGQIFVTPGNP